MQKLLSYFNPEMKVHIPTKRECQQLLRSTSMTYRYIHMAGFTKMTVIVPYVGIVQSFCHNPGEFNATRYSSIA